MVKSFLKPLVIVMAIALFMSFSIGISPAFATTLSLKTEGIAKRDGILSGQLTLFVILGLLKIER
jgi:hypothetical protein